MKTNPIITVNSLGFPWETQDPFLFCVHHEDFYPKGNTDLGPLDDLKGRNLGSDFTIKDGYRMYHGKKVPGFPAHPHRGFETVTIARKGLVDHSDSMGASGRFGNGDVQWMTAGKGVQHAEMFPLLNKTKENPFELFQIWINLPKVNKFVEPHFKMLWNEDLKIEKFEDAKGGKSEISIVTGEISGSGPTPPPDSWAADLKNNVAIWNIKIDANAEVTIPITEGNINRNLYFFKGDKISIENTLIEVYKGVELNAAIPTIIKNGNKPAHLLLLQGKPIGEPVVKYGPFVMNTNEEVQQAMNDFQNTQFGGWPWPKRDQVHDELKGRFAKHADGRLEDKSK
jgi:redox-sensitive bicupin YhaK (pirin superfamily)